MNKNYTIVYNISVDLKFTPFFNLYIVTWNILKFSSYFFIIEEKINKHDAIIKKYEAELKFGNMLLLHTFVLHMFKSIYVIIAESTPWINLYLITCHIFIPDLYIHEYIWKIIDNPLKDSINDMAAISILKL